MRPLAVLAAMLPLAGPALASPAYIPPPGIPFDIQLQGKTAVVQGTTFLEVDMVETTAQQVAAFHGKGVHVACYVDAGTAETYRPDYARFPQDLLGKKVGGYPDERWLDIRAIDRLAPIITDRITACRQKGFDAIDFDNVDGYENKTGFPLKAADSVAYDSWLAGQAHAQGLAVALKNALGLIPQLVDSFDWAVNESCYDYHECNLLQPFIDQGKAVFAIEYVTNAATRKRDCQQAAAQGIELVFKTPALKQQLARCP